MGRPLTCKGLKLYVRDYASRDLPRQAKLSACQAPSIPGYITDAPPPDHGRIAARLTIHLAARSFRLPALRPAISGFGVAILSSGITIPEHETAVLRLRIAMLSLGIAILKLRIAIQKLSIVILKLRIAKLKLKLAIQKLRIAIQSFSFAIQGF